MGLSAWGLVRYFIQKSLSQTYDILARKEIPYVTEWQLAYYRILILLKCYTVQFRFQNHSSVKGAVLLVLGFNCKMFFFF